MHTQQEQQKQQEGTQQSWSGWLKQKVVGSSAGARWFSTAQHGACP